MKKKLTKWQQEYIDSFHRLHKSPRYIDFEFYVIEFMYCIHYIAEKDKVYVVTVSIAPFLALMHGVNLNRNPFGDKNSDTTPDYIWAMIAAYCRTYGSVKTKEQAKEHLNCFYCVEKDGIHRQMGRAVQLSRADLRYFTDQNAGRDYADINVSELRVFTPKKEQTDTIDMDKRKAV